jgi:predicted nucleic acid-binding protein
VARLPDGLASLPQRAVIDDRFWITPIVRMEILYSARTSSEYADLEVELDALRILRNDRAVADTAASALIELARPIDMAARGPSADMDR